MAEYENAIRELSEDKERLVALDSYRQQHIAVLQGEVQRLEALLEEEQKPPPE